MLVVVIAVTGKLLTGVENTLANENRVTVKVSQKVTVNRIPFEITRDPYSLEKAISDTCTRTNLYGPYASAEDAVASMLKD